MPDVSILMTLREDFTQRIEKMRAAGSQFSKELDTMESKMESHDKRMQALSQRQAEYTVELEKAQKALNQAQAAYNRKPTAEREEALRLATSRVTDLKNSLTTVTGAMRDTRLEYRAMGKDLTAMEKGTYGIKKESNLSLLMRSGLINMAGQAVSGAAGAFLTSAYGDDIGSGVMNVLGGVASGAAMGSLAGPVGIAVGSLVGGITGLINTATEIFEKKDDAFRDRVREQYDELTQGVEDTLETGSEIAGSREQNLVAFTQRFHSENAARGYLNYVQDFAEKTNYDYDEIVGYSQKLLNSYSPTEVFRVLTALSDATAGLNLSTSDVDQMIAGLSRMRTTGKTTQEYLNYFSERGVDVYTALSEGLGVDKSELPSMVTKGEINGTDAAEMILSFIEETFGGLSDKLASTFDAIADNLQDAQKNIDAAMGEGYNEKCAEGMEQQIEFLSGPLGEKMKDSNRVIGEWQAALENSKDALNRDAMDILYNGAEGAQKGNQYFDAETGDLTESGRQLQEAHNQMMEGLKAYDEGDMEGAGNVYVAYLQAQAIAANEYATGEGAQLMQEAQNSLVDAIQASVDTTSAYEAGYALGQNFSQGVQAGMNDNRPSASDFFSGMTSSGTYSGGAGHAADYRATGGKSLSTSDIPRSAPSVKANTGKSHAYGLGRVPYDDYPAILHRDEQVLTAAEARSRAAMSAPTVNVTVTGNEFQVRDESDMDDIAYRIAEKVSQAIELQAGGAA